MSRRKSTLKYPRPAAREAAPSLREQFAQMEDVLRDVQGRLDTQFKKIAALQAQVDHLVARVAGRYDGV